MSLGWQAEPPPERVLLLLRSKISSLVSRHHHCSCSKTCLEDSSNLQAGPWPPRGSRSWLGDHGATGVEYGRIARRADASAGRLVQGVTPLHGKSRAAVLRAPWLSVPGMLIAHDSLKFRSGFPGLGAAALRRGTRRRPGSLRSILKRGGWSRTGSSAQDTTRTKRTRVLFGTGYGASRCGAWGAAVSMRGGLPPRRVRCDRLRPSQTHR